MMGSSPRCYIRSFMEIGPLFLKGFTIYGRGSDQHHVNKFSFAYMHVHNLVKNGPVVSEKIKF